MADQIKIQRGTIIADDIIANNAITGGSINAATVTATGNLSINSIDTPELNTTTANISGDVTAGTITSGTTTVSGEATLGETTITGNVTINGGMDTGTKGKAIIPVYSQDIQIIDNIWYNNTDQSVINISPATWDDTAKTCHLISSIPVTLNGVTWLGGIPEFDSTQSVFEIELNQTSASLITAVLKGSPGESGSGASVAEHEANMALHVSDDERQKWNEVVESNKSTYRWTSEPTSENTRFYALDPLILAPQGVQTEPLNQLEKPNGKFNKLELQFSKETDGWDIGETVYAAILSGNSEEEAFMGFSKNAVQLTPGGKGIFEFDFDLDFTEENGYELLIMFCRDKEGNDNVMVGFDVDQDGWPNMSGLYWTSQPHQTYGRIFLGLESESVHSEDTTVHISSAERQVLNELVSPYYWTSEPNSGDTEVLTCYALMLSSSESNLGGFPLLTPFDGPTGKFNRLALQFSETTGDWATGEPVYAHVAIGLLGNNASFRHIGCSKNTIQLTPGGKGIFEFDFDLDFTGDIVYVLYFRRDKVFVSQFYIDELMSGELIQNGTLQHSIGFDGNTATSDIQLNMLGIGADNSLVVGRIFLGLGGDLVHSNDTSVHVTPEEKALIQSNLPITFDDTPTEGSTNAVTSGGIYTAMQHSGSAAKSICIGEGAINNALMATVIGPNAKIEPTNAHRSVAIGFSTQATWYDSVALGNESLAKRASVAIGAGAAANGDNRIAIGYLARANVDCSAALGYQASNSTPNSIVLSARSYANTRFVLTLIAGTATGDAGSILSDTPFVTGSTLKLTVYDGVSGISETLSIDAAALFTLLQTAGGTVTLTNPNA